MSFTLINHFNQELIRQLHHLYQQEWWCKGRSLEETASCVEGSQVCLGFTDANEKLVGFSRVLTDFTFKALIFDVIVDSQYRGLGLGQRLMQEIRQYPQLQQVKHFELYCLPEMEPFYAQMGFSDDVGGIQLMRLSSST